MSSIRRTSSANPATGVYDMSAYRQRAAGAAAPGVEGADRAGISESARELGRASAIVEAAADVRPEQIRELRHSIANGAYQPDPRVIAERILERGL